MGPDNLFGLTLVCLGVERVIAVTWPLRAKSLLTLRFSAVLETTVNVLILVPLFVLLCFDYKLDPQYGCWYDFSLSITVLYIMMEESIPLMRSFISLGISIYLIVIVVSSKLKRSQISIGGGISAREISNIATLIVFDVVSLTVLIPNALFYWIYAAILVLPSAFSADFTSSIYQLSDFSDCFTLIPHALAFFIHFSRSKDFRKALFGNCFKRVKI